MVDLEVLTPPALPVPTPPAVGRKTNRERHGTEIAAAEGKFARKLPEIADNMVDMAMGRTVPRCPIHRHKFTCTDPECTLTAPSVPENWTAMKYIMDRIAGAPTPKDQAVIQQNFVQKVAMTIARLFNEVNMQPDPTERARQFAVGISGLLATIMTEEDNA